MLIIELEDDDDDDIIVGDEKATAANLAAGAAMNTARSVFKDVDLMTVDMMIEFSSSSSSNDTEVDGQWVNL